MKQSIEFRAALTVHEGMLACDYRFPYSWDLSPKSAWTFVDPLVDSHHVAAVMIILRNRGVK